MNKTQSLVAAAALICGACASIPEDLGRGDVDLAIAARGFPATADVSAPVRRVEELLSQPLTVSTAVEIALLNNPALQGNYAQLGFGAAEIYAGSRIRNPVIAIGRFDSNAPGARDRMTAGVIASISDLITLPTRRELATLDNAAVQQQVAAEVAAIAASTAKRFVSYSATMQTRLLKRQASRAARVSADLAARFFDAGNVDEVMIAAQRAAAAEAQIEALNADVHAVNARTRLAEILGVPAEDDWSADMTLGSPNQAPPAIDELVAEGNAKRLDLSAAAAMVDANAKRSGLENWRTWLGDADIAYERERESDGEKLRGFGAELPIPLFDRGRAEYLRADAALRSSVADVLRLQLAVRNDVQRAHTAASKARERIEIISQSLIPARRASVTGVQQRVNFMLLGVFELIEAKQEEYEAYERYIDAIRDYWIARTDLAQAVGIALPEADLAAATPIDIESLTRGAAMNGAPAMPEHNHHQHHQEGAK